MLAPSASPTANTNSYTYCYSSTVLDMSGSMCSTCERAIGWRYCPISPIDGQIVRLGIVTLRFMFSCALHRVIARVSCIRHPDVSATILANGVQSLPRSVDNVLPHLPDRTGLSGRVQRSASHPVNGSLSVSSMLSSGWTNVTRITSAYCNWRDRDASCRG